MDLEGKIRQSVDRVLGELNQMLPAGQRLENSADTVLVGEGTALDSLGLVNLVVLLEQEIADAMGVQIALSEDPELISEDGPCRTLGSLTEHLSSRLKDQPGG